MPPNVTARLSGARSAAVALANAQTAVSTLEGQLAAAQTALTDAETTAENARNVAIQAVNDWLDSPPEDPAP